MVARCVLPFKPNVKGSLIEDMKCRSFPAIWKMTSAEVIIFLGNPSNTIVLSPVRSYSFMDIHSMRPDVQDKIV